MSTTYRERTSRIAVSTYLPYATGWVMRVWREEKLDDTHFYEPGRNQVDPDIAATISKHVQFPVTPLKLAQAVLDLDRVNACEVVDFTGYGEVLYKDWP
jgi:hypothetical protein